MRASQQLDLRVIDLGIAQESKLRDAVVIVFQERIGGLTEASPLVRAASSPPQGPRIAE
jgi:hypothetical protein